MNLNGRERDMIVIAPMNRHEAIRESLHALQETGQVASWYAYAPGDKGKVWVVETMGSTRSFTTREVEAFILGVKATMFAEALR